MACRLKCECDQFADGIILGKSVPIDKKFQQPLSMVFQTLLKDGTFKRNKPSLVFGDNVLTFTEVDEFSTALACDLRDRMGMNVKIENPDSEAVIATCISNSEKAIVLILAILKTGAAYLPLDEYYPEKLLLDVIDTFRPVLLVANENGPIYNKFDSNQFSEKCKVMSLEELWLDMEIPLEKKSKKRKSHHTVIPEILKNFPSHPTLSPELCSAAVFHTRGYHGNPVGVRMSHLSIVNRCLFDVSKLKVKKNESCSLSLSISVGDSIAQIFVPLLHGCTLFIFRRSHLRDMSEFIKTVAVKNINRLSVPYFLFRQFLEAIDTPGKKETVRSLRCVKHVIIRGGFLRPNEVIQFYEMFKKVTLYNCTGPPETSGEVVYEKFKSIRDYQKRRRFGKLLFGRVLNNVRVYILSDHLNIISDGRQGEVCCAGMCLSLGYVNQSKLSDQKHIFVKNPHDDTPEFGTLFRSGEYGRIIEAKDGKRCLYLEGRDDRLIKRFGHEIHTDDVRLYLAELSFAKEAFVYVLHRGKLTQQMVGFILPKKGVSLLNIPDTLEIEHSLRSNLPEWAIPDDIMVVEEAPKHASGRMCPCCLIQSFREQRQPKVASWKKLMLPPETMEAAGVLIKTIYKFTSIPVDTVISKLHLTFFELGGTSVNTVPILIFLNKRGYAVTIKDFYDNPILSDFITVMAAKRPVGQKKIESSESIVSRVVSGIRPNFHLMLDLKNEYTVEVMRKKHRNAAIHLVATAYCERGELHAYNMVSYEDMTLFLEHNWPAHEEEQLSLIIMKKSNHRILAIAVCQDYFRLIDTAKANGALFNIVEFYHEVKGNMINLVPHRAGETLEIAWMATLHTLHPVENIKLITMLHTELIKFVKKSPYSAIFNPTINILSRTLCTEVFGYKLIDDFQVNKYKEVDGSFPFHIAGDAVACAALMLRIKDPAPPSEQSTLTLVDPVKYFEKLSNKGLAGMTSFDTVSVKT